MGGRVEGSEAAVHLCSLPAAGLLGSTERKLAMQEADCSAEAPRDYRPLGMSKGQGSGTR